MKNHDIVIRNANAVTASDARICDIGINAGKIAEVGPAVASGAREIDAGGQYVFPGGVDSHCHIEQLTSSRLMCADDFYTGTRSAAFGGTTSIMSFAAQHKGDSLFDVVSDYQARAEEKAVIDFAFHIIVSDPREDVLKVELPALIAQGHSSFKVYMTYETLRLNDYQMLDVFSLARKHGALTMIHAESYDIIRWLTERLIACDATAPKFHAIAHARLAESEATTRAITLAEFIDTPCLIVHVSSQEAMEAIERAQQRGLKVFAETCPQYLFLTADDIDRPDMEGAKYCCSPPPRDKASQQAIWRGLQDGIFQVFSSDHAPFRFDESGKLSQGRDVPFTKIANGVPGLEVRMPLLFSEGVLDGRIDIHQFVELTSTRAAKMYGMYPQKGSLSVGADADLVIWDEKREVTIRWEDLHDNVGYTPYEGRKITGWPETVISRGRIIVEDGNLYAERGSGQLIPRSKPDSVLPLGKSIPEKDLAIQFGAKELF